MKKIISLLFLLSLLIFGAITADAASLWSKYVATDMSYSFHYPSGWKVISNDSTVGAENSKTNEQLMMVMLPFDQLKSPQDLANGLLDMLKNGNPNICASHWRSLIEATDEQVIFDLADKIEGKEYSGLGIVVKSDQQAIWFSYFAPASDYYQIRGYNILQGFIGSLASGSTSKAPSIDYSVDVAGNIDRNAKAFMFVLEFTLGAPFTKSQENLILDELQDSWRYLSDEELKEYDQYPSLVNNILKMKQKDLEELRADLEKTILEWLDETDQSNQVVKLINSNLKNRGRVVIKGEPPLTEMSLTAYSEIIAYSRLLQKDSKAKPDQISQKSVNKIKKQVKKVWQSFSITDRQDIATAPGLWVCLRVQLKYGSKKEQDKIRDNLKKLEAVTRNIDTSNGTGTKSSNKSGTEKPMDMTTHWCMMQMQQQTFNTYMWSQGFNYLPATGKMW
jgi:hypothetical protein